MNCRVGQPMSTPAAMRHSPHSSTRLPIESVIAPFLSDTALVRCPVITDLTVSAPDSTTPELHARKWYRIQKNLFLGTSQQSAWLYIAVADEKELGAEDLVVTGIAVGGRPSDPSPYDLWESRPGGIWLIRSKFSGEADQVVTELDILFGTDAVDPRPRWTLIPHPLQIDAPSNVPVAKLSVLRGRVEARPDTRAPLRVGEDGKFRIVQISDTHMVTGVGICKDAIDACGNWLPDSDADPRTVRFISAVLDAEQPDLVVLTGDQLHHDVLDSQSALFKLLAPIIDRARPFAAVFGNHDSEGRHALTRTAQMSILQNLPQSFCESGPEQVDGIGNYCLQILAPPPSTLPLSTLYFLDSHGQALSSAENSGTDYEPIKQSQIDWLVNTSQALRGARHDDDDGKQVLSLAFLHIPLPEFGSRDLDIRSGRRGEPTESPKFNSHFYDALVKAGVSALGCGHDHVNDFCALLPRQAHHGNGQSIQNGPWLCYGGGSGFGGYCSYGRQRYHRGTRVWEIDTKSRSLKTWKRVEYIEGRVDELVLVANGR